jgi:C1A family cysteine protease
MRQELAEVFTPSRLFIYYNERSDEGTIGQDAGGALRDGIQTVATLGAPPESDWPYSDDPTTFTELPPPQAYTDAQQHLVSSYDAVSQDLTSLKAVLALGYPIVFGFSVYESFESDAVAASGFAPMPGPNEQFLGGHAVMLVGYDDSQTAFIVRNSWGSSWGQAGYFTLPYEYVCDPNLASDFWTVKTTA